VGECHKQPKCGWKTILQVLVAQVELHLLGKYQLLPPPDHGMQIISGRIRHIYATTINDIVKKPHCH